MQIFSRTKTRIRQEPYVWNNQWPIINTQTIVGCYLFQSPTNMVPISKILNYVHISGGIRNRWAFYYSHNCMNFAKTQFFHVSQIGLLWADKKFTDRVLRLIREFHSAVQVRGLHFTLQSLTIYHHPHHHCVAHTHESMM